MLPPVAHLFCFSEIDQAQESGSLESVLAWTILVDFSWLVLCLLNLSIQLSNIAVLLEIETVLPTVSSGQVGFPPQPAQPCLSSLASVRPLE